MADTFEDDVALLRERLHAARVGLGESYHVDLALRRTRSMIEAA